MKQVCGCCEPPSGLTPAEVENRPGLSAIAYRIGTYSSFRETMLERIATTVGLESLSTRNSDDYAITMIELWAAIADVLTFYQERYANEAYLRTARLRESIGRLARLLDYHLRPGAAALARLAFTLDDGKGLALSAGFKVQSVPGKDEQPQTFETIEDLPADARLNRLRIYPAPNAVFQLAQGRNSSILDRVKGPGLGATIAPNNELVFFNDGTADPVEEKTIASVQTEDDRVVINWKKPIQAATWGPPTSVFQLGRSFRVFGYNAPAQFMTAAPQSAGAPQRIVWSIHTLRDSDYAYPSSSVEQGDTSSSTICLDARYDGLSVGQQLLVDDTHGKKHLVTITRIDQVTDTLGPASDTVTRLIVAPAIFPPPATIFRPRGSRFTAAAGSALFARAGGGFRAGLAATSFGGAGVDRRNMVVHQLVGPEISFWTSDYPATITSEPIYVPGFKVVDDLGEGIEVGRTIEKGHFKPGVILRTTDFAPGRTVLLLDDLTQQVLASISTAPTIAPADVAPGGFCHLVLSLSFQGPLTLNTATAALLGNVALASHGETVRDEVVGSGNASLRFQRFALRKKPLTYVPSAKAGGLDNTLTLLVNGVRWKEVSGLLDQPPTSQVYAARTADDGSTELQFGDGLSSGAVLPTGQNNITATYRVGIGLAGRVGANSLTTLLQRPPGLKGVVNPLPADGGADPETSDHARQNAPLTVRTFGRAISLKDFEDLVTESGEVAKAQATWVWDGLARSVYLTVAGQQGGTFAPEDLARLVLALTAARDPNHRLRAGNFVRVPVLVTARLIIDPDFVRATVLAEAAGALTASLSFDALALGQSIHLSAIFSTLQSVAGVTSADVTRFMFKKPSTMSDAAFDSFLTFRVAARLPDGAPAPVQPHLRIFNARPDLSAAGQVLPAEIAWIEAAANDVVITGTGGL